MTTTIPDDFRSNLRRRMSADLDAGRDLGLAAYLREFPGREEAVALEYFSAIEEFRRRENVDDDASSRASCLGSYRLIKELGRGGQGVVWLAEDMKLGRKVALKVLSDLGAGAADVLARFRREAELASKLEHPGICGVFDAGVAGGVPYIAMRYVEGETLSERIQRLGSQNAGSATTFVVDRGDDTELVHAAPPLAPTKTSVDRTELSAMVKILEQAALALHAAHEVGIVHRDIKPGNIMISRDGQPVLLDFGLARDDSEFAGPSLTQTGDLFGTPAYMSPEQISGHRGRIDRRTDIYSLGVTLYECLTLKRPFVSPTRESLYQAILAEEVLPVRRLNRQIPADLEVVVLCAMEKDRDKRYQTAADFAEDLRHIQNGEPIRAKKVSAVGRAWRWSKRRPAAAVLIAALLFGVPTVSILGAWYWRHQGDVLAQEKARIDELVEEALESGFYEMHEGGNADRAAASFARALSANGGSAEAVVGLAFAHLKRGVPDEALRAITEGERHVANPKALVRTKANVLVRLGRDTEARVVMESAPPIAGPLMWFLEGTRAVEAGHRAPLASTEKQAAFREAAESFARAVALCPRARRTYHAQLAHAIGHLESDNVQAGEIVAEAIGDLWPTWARGWYWSGFALSSSKSDKEVSALQTAIRLDPGFAAAHSNLGIALRKKGQLGEASAAFREAIKLTPDDADAHYGLGGALKEQGKWDEALAAYREAIRLDPKHARAYAYTGATLAEQGKLDAAVLSYREAIRLEPNYARAYTFLGVTLAVQGMRDEAVAAHREAIRLDPKDAEAHNNLGVALPRDGNLDEVVATFREAIRLDPGNSAPYTNLGSVLSDQGKFEEAIEAHREAIRLKPASAGAYTNLGSELSASGRLDEAIAAHREAIRLEPGLTAAHLNLSVALRKKGFLDDALTASLEAVRLGPDNAAAHSNLGDVLLRQGKLNEAVAAHREAIRLAPGSASAHADLGYALTKMGKVDEATRVFREAIQRNTNNARVHYNLGNNLLSQRQLDEASVSYREAIRLDPNLGEAHANLGVVLQRQGKSDEAIGAYREAIRVAPDLVQAHTGLGKSLQQQGKLGEAAAAFQESIRLAPGVASTHINLGQTYITLGKLDEAAACYREAFRLAPGNATDHCNVGVIFAKQDKLDEAIASYREAIRLDPRHVMAHTYLATVFLKQGRLDECLAAYHEAIRLDPNAPQPRAGLRQALQRAGKIEELLLVLREDVERRPNDPAALNSLAWLLVDPDGNAEIRDPASAIPLARKAVNLGTRSDPLLLDTLATALHANGDFEEAVAIQEEILRILDGKDRNGISVERVMKRLDLYRRDLASKRDNPQGSLPPE